MPPSSTGKKRIAPVACSYSGSKAKAFLSSTPPRHNNDTANSKRTPSSSKSSRKRQKREQQQHNDNNNHDSDSDEDDLKIKIRPLHSPNGSQADSANSKGTAMHNKKNNDNSDSEDLEVWDVAKQAALESDADDDNDEADENDIPEAPTTEQLSCLCWKCHVTLKMPPSKASSTTGMSSPQPQSKSSFCYYAMHVHPILQVPICSVCNEEVLNSYDETAAAAAAQRKQSATSTKDNDDDNASEDDDDDVCCGCASIDDEARRLLFLCDNNGNSNHLQSPSTCSREQKKLPSCCPVAARTAGGGGAFCQVCVAQANGGGREGAQFVEQLMNDDNDDSSNHGGDKNDSPWYCLVCAPPPALKALQEELEQTATPTVGLSQDSTQDNLQQQQQQEDSEPRSVEKILEELGMVEAEQRACQQEWDDADAMKAKRQEIDEEIQAAKPHLSVGKRKALVEDEFEAYLDLCTKHDHRLGDMASSLQEELESLHNVDLAMMYKTCFSKKKKKSKEEIDNGEGSSNIDNDADDSDDEDNEPDWKHAADKEISKRRLAEPTTTIQPIHPPNVYLKESYADVEDLMTKPEDERDCPGLGFRSTQDRPSKAQINDAMRIEDELLAEKHVRIRHQIDNAMDLEEMRVEEQETSQQGAEGVSRVRRDSTFLAKRAPSPEMLQVRSERKKTPPLSPPSLLPPAIPPTPAAKLPLSEDQESSPEDETRTDVATAANASATTAEAAADTIAHNKPDSKRNNVPKSAAASAVVDLTDDSPLMSRKPRRHFAGAAANHLNEGFREARSKYGSQECRNNDFDDEYYCSTDPRFAESDLVLSAPDQKSTGGKRVKTISVSTELVKHLKPHQKEGVKFMWNNACIDFNYRTSRAEEIPREVGGCILAHSMGLGKSLSTITLLFTLLNHPSLVDSQGDGLVPTALLIVPVNTISSWVTEFDKWTRKLKPSVLLYNLQNCKPDGRGSVIDQWQYRGGVLVVSKDTFATCVKKHPTLQSPGPSIVVLDEAHLMLSNKKSVIYKALSGIQTKRRVLLTGSPFQNNALEYYRMIRFIRPDILDSTESAFEREFAIPIDKGMPSDATPAEVQECELKSCQLKNILAPYVHRKDSTVLRETLPPMQQVILHVRQSKMQSNLYKALKRFEQKNGITNFLTRYALARPLHNHPACLLMKPSSPASDDSSLDSAEKEWTKKTWWDKYADRVGVDKMKKARNGTKVILLLHILAHADTVGDKVVVFSQCLKTLDFLESVLQLDCWADHVKSLAEAFPGTKLGGWTNGMEYLRLDGSDSAEGRGVMIKRFNKADGQPARRVKVFLISCKAGGIGITLTGANRVVCFDTHFNPTIMNQSIGRVYRYGQEKPVFAYRFLTEGTGEEKIYQRSVNKTGLSLRVIDGKNFKGNFTQDQLADLILNDTWVQCETCEKWRMLLGGVEEEDLPEKWYCHMNKFDTVNNTCESSEKSKSWYHRQFRLKCVDLGAQRDATGPDATGPDGGDWRDEDRESAKAAKDTAAEASKEAKKQALVKNDKVLSQLLSPDNSTWQLISKYYYHDTLLECEVDENGGKQDDSQKNTKEEQAHEAQDDSENKKPAAMARQQSSPSRSKQHPSKSPPKRGPSDTSMRTPSSEKEPKFKLFEFDSDSDSGDVGAYDSSWQKQSKKARTSSSHGLPAPKPPPKQTKEEPPVPSRSPGQYSSSSRKPSPPANKARKKSNNTKPEPEIIELLLSSDDEE